MDITPQYANVLHEVPYFLSLPPLFILFFTPSLTSSLTKFKCFLDDGDGLTELFLVDAEGRCETDDMVVGWFGQQSFLHHADAEIPGGSSFHRFGDDGVEQSASAHLFDEGGMDFLHLLAEESSHLFSILHEVFVLDHLQGFDRHAGSQGEAAKGGAMLARTDIEHDIVVSQTG